MTTIRETREKQYNIIILEIFAVSVYFGYFVYKSWYIGGATFFIGNALMYIPYIKYLFISAISLFWGFLIFIIITNRYHLSQAEGIVICFFSFLTILGIHLGALRHASTHDIL